MIKIQHISTICFFLLVFSCAEKFINDIEIEVPQEELQLVINLELSAGDTIAQTFVARTANIDEGESTFFSDAIVELYKEDDLLSLLEYDINTNEYSTSLEPDLLVPGNYSIEVSGIDGFEDIKATQSIPPEVNVIDGTYQENGTVEQYYGYAYTVDEALITIDDPADQENYYHVKLFGVIEDADGIIRSISEFFTTSLDPFAETSFYYDGILLRDDTFNGEAYDLSVGFSNFFNYNYGYPGSDDDTTYLIVELNNVSRDYYLYTKSLAAQLNAIDNPFAEPVVVHNNVENGIGIFSARNPTRFRIDFE